MLVLSVQQVAGLFILAIPIACIARTVVYEEIFREPREYCRHRSQSCPQLLKRKFFYLFTCEYCFSHYVTLAALAITQFHLMYDDWRGLVVAFFALVFVANFYLALYARLRVDITSEKKAIDVREREIAKIEQELSDSNAGKPADGQAEADRAPPLRATTK